MRCQPERRMMTLWRILLVLSASTAGAKPILEVPPVPPGGVDARPEITTDLHNLGAFVRVPAISEAVTVGQCDRVAGQVFLQQFQRFLG